MLEITSDR